MRRNKIKGLVPQTGLVLGSLVFGTLVFATLVFATLCLPPMAQAQGPGEAAVWYVVRPGDSLRQVTQRYLGSQDRWQENWRLNPTVENPNALVSGQRLRIIVSEGLPQRTARLLSVHRAVEESPAPLDWSPAEAEDLLLERDGVRTQAASSTELEFPGGQLMRVTENSLVFIRDRPQQLEAPSRQSVEIIHGQADLEGGSVDHPENDVELVLGATTARPRPTAAGPAEARARRPRSGGAKVMLYKGEGEVAAGGAQVQLSEGTGTSVPEVGVPSPPEKLLPAPALLAPEAGTRLAFANPVLEWRSVESAQEYTVEICGDPDCGRLLSKVDGLKDPPWRSDGLPLGDLYWRVTARSASGLDGYPSEGTPLSILSDELDHDPPTVMVRSHGPSAQIDGRVYLGYGSRLEVVAEDSQSGIGRRDILFNGEPAPETLPELQQLGRQTLGGSVGDRVGNRRELEPYEAVFDPEPPTITWQTVDALWWPAGGMITKAWPTGPRNEVDNMSKKRRQNRDKRRGKIRSTRRRKASAADLEWSGSGRTWQTLNKTWRAPEGVATILLRTRPGSGSLTLQGPDVQLDENSRLRIELADNDGGIGLGQVDFGLRPGESGGKVLFLEARDRLGNLHSESWPLQGRR